jgi:hypothetical protein
MCHALEVVLGGAGNFQKSLGSPRSELAKDSAGTVFAKAPRNWNESNNCYDLLLTELERKYCTSWPQITMADIIMNPSSAALFSHRPSATAWEVGAILVAAKSCGRSVFSKIPKEGWLAINA